MISVSNLTKVYGTVLAVDNVSFEVGKGQVVGFLGPNGAGKSTTIRMLACYLPPTSGGATVNGFDIFHESEPVRASLGIFPRTARSMRKCAWKNASISAAACAASIVPPGESASITSSSCWLSAVRRRPIGHLSKGYRQRVGLADALLHNPAVLILDEPTVGLDPTQIIETRKLIKELGGQHTVLLSTHILPEVEAVCDRAIIIAGGRIAAQGSPEELRTSRRASARVLIECKGPPEAVTKALQKINGAANVEILSGSAPGHDGYITAAISSKESRDVREEAAKAIVQNGWPLREIRLEHATLEEFFVQVTASQALGRAGTGSGDNHGSAGGKPGRRNAESDESVNKQAVKAEGGVA